MGTQWAVKCAELELRDEVQPEGSSESRSEGVCRGRHAKERSVNADTGERLRQTREGMFH